MYTPLAVLFVCWQTPLALSTALLSSCSVAVCEESPQPHSADENRERERERERVKLHALLRLKFSFDLHSSFDLRSLWFWLLNSKHVYSDIL